MRNLTQIELVEINGGHDGVAYQAGQIVGAIIKVVGIVSGSRTVIGLFKKLF
jgi:hypothetical protein